MASISNKTIYQLDLEEGPFQLDLTKQKCHYPKDQDQDQTIAEVAAPYLAKGVAFPLIIGRFKPANKKGYYKFYAGDQLLEFNKDIHHDFSTQNFKDPDTKQVIKKIYLLILSKEGEPFWPFWGSPYKQGICCFSQSYLESSTCKKAFDAKFKLLSLLFAVYKNEKDEKEKKILIHQLIFWSKSLVGENNQDSRLQLLCCGLLSLDSDSEVHKKEANNHYTAALLLCPLDVVESVQKIGQRFLDGSQNDVEDVIGGFFSIAQKDVFTEKKE